MYEQTKNFNVFYFSLWTLLSLSVSSFTTAGVIYCIPSKWYIRGLIVHRSHLRKIWHFPRAVMGLKFQRSYTGQLHFPNLPDAQDNEQHDVKRLNHGSLMLIIFSFRGRFDNCCCHLLHTSENTFKMIYTWSNCSSFTFEKNLAFPTGSNGVEVPTIIHWSTTLP